MTYRQAVERARRANAKIVEVVNVNGAGRLNIVHPGGRPETICFHRAKLTRRQDGRA